ncbi:MAG: alpha/beta fold hydrolase [Devosia sp.]|uniref:alpha/beta fold hydrolase n=1 Tax=Devosia sp. TaxID=1871048 RepID=UPI0024C6E369|nr:alpha/beta hydrolase [Devosia sp.]UYN99220.1 MAG: alpha/beta fold hydrolase [Devosia sp.]
MDTHTFHASDGTRLVYADCGKPDGPAVVLCHGLGAGAAQFGADAAWLSERGYRVLVPDLRGHGASGTPPEPEQLSYSLDRLARDQIEMLDHAGMGRVHWAGNSLGGIIGLVLAAHHPERLASLATFGTALSLDLPAWTGRMVTLFDAVPGRAITARMTAWSTTRNRTARPLVEHLLGQYDGRAVAAITDTVRRYDLTSAATGWAGPGLVLVGGRDAAVNRALRPQLAALRDRRNWRVAELPEGGHCANLDATEDWRAALVSFWREAAASSPAGAS